MKQPEDCLNLEDIRTEIDALDCEIIGALGKRFQYVKAAAKFKNSPTSVRTPDRFKSMLEPRRTWAEAENLNPDIIEKIYRDLVNYFINEELKAWQTEKR